MTSKGTVLVADDEAMLRRVVKKVLTRSGYEVDLAENGQQAVHLYDPNRYDLVILDRNMPILDGIGALKKIRDIDPQARIVIASGESKEDILAAAAPDMPTALLPKPFTPRSLIDALETFIA